MERFDIKKINDDNKETKRLKISKRVAASEKVHGSGMAVVFKIKVS
jgi:hypothetical protein